MAPLIGVFSALLATANVALSAATNNQTRYNPAIPGWHSDPSCVFVAERDNTTFCTASTFLLTPGLPVYATKDLTNFKLVSHVLSRESQYPQFNESLAQSDGIWAPTIRYHDGTFYLATMYRNGITGSSTGLIFNSTDPYSDRAWSDPIVYNAEYIDPALFWDDDGSAYVVSSGTYLQTVDLTTGSFGPARNIWNGSTGEFLEGPRLYKKDNYYYLLTAEGGSGLNHSVTMARSLNITGPYQGCPSNPVLTNRGTDQYIQNVGHADLFHDQQGQWWSSALGWRSGPEALTYPMGRELFLTPVTWEAGAWPIFHPMRGVYSGWSLPENRVLEGSGPFAKEPDLVDFAPNTTIPKNFGYWRFPNTSSFAVSPAGHPYSLEITPSATNITAGYKNYTAGYVIADLSLIMRRQTDTLFQYSVDASFKPTAAYEEVGVTAFLNQVQNIALGIVNLPANAVSNSSNSTLAPYFRFIASGLGSAEKNIPGVNVVPVPSAWLQDPAIRLIVTAQNETHYSFAASPSAHPYERIVLGFAPGSILSGGAGDFTGKHSLFLRPCLNVSTRIGPPTDTSSHLRYSRRRIRDNQRWLWHYQGVYL